MAVKSIRAWLGIDAPEEPEFAPLRETLEALDHLEPHRARFLAAFAYLLGRVARADLQVSTEETRTMEALVREQGQLSQDQAMVVVQLAKTSNLLFGGTANFLVAREFSELATYEPDTGNFLVRNGATGAITPTWWGFPGEAPVPADYDGDGDVDLATWNPSNGWWFIRTNTGDLVQVQWGAAGDLAVPAM